MIKEENTKLHNSVFQMLPWIIPTISIILWAVISETGLIPTYLLPHPVEIGKAGYTYIFGTPGKAPFAGRFLSDAGASLIRVFSGFAVAVILGIPLGILSGRLASVRKLLSNTINGLRSVPGISWVTASRVRHG